MNDSIDVAIPAATESGNREGQLSLYFQAMLQDLSGSFAEALDPGCDHRKSNAIPDRVTISRVSLDGNRIEIHYHVELSVFNACNLQTDHYSFRRSVMGSRDGNVWRFSKYMPLPERSSADEF